jgi:hypothetical protein
LWEGERGQVSIVHQGTPRCSNTCTVGGGKSAEANAPAGTEIMPGRNSTS